jgi:hypothetical protein
MALNPEKEDMLEAAVAGIPRGAQTIAAVPAKHRARALKAAEQGNPQTIQNLGYAEAAPLNLRLSDDLLQYIADEANRRGHSLGGEIVRRLLDSRAQDARQAALQQIDSTATAVESAMDAVQRLLTLVRPSISPPHPHERAVAPQQRVHQGSGDVQRD